MTRLSTHVAFVKLLNEASTSKKYLTLKDGQHTNIDQRMQKTMRTKDIALYANTVFDFYQQEPLSIEKKAQLMKDLGSAITAYKQRVQRSKNWFARFFRCVSKGEKSLTSTLAAAKAQELECSRKLPTFKELTGTNCLSIPQIRLIQANYKLFKNAEDFPEDVGKESTPLMAMLSYLEDLISFSNVMPEALLEDLTSDSNVVPPFLIDALQFAVSIGHFDACDTYKELSNQEIVKERDLRIMEKIQDLQQNGEIGEHILIPGPDLKTGKSSYFQIVKTEKDNCTFIQARSVDFPNGKRVNYYATEMRFSEFTLPFIQNFKTDTSYQIGFVNWPYDYKLDHSGRPFRSDFALIKFWLYKSLGKEKYTQFKTYVTEQELLKLQQIEATKLSPKESELLEKMKQQELS